MAGLAVLSCAAALLVGPGPAQATDFGGSTGTAPNATYGCEAGPRLYNANGDYAVFASGTATCTWAQLPTVGGTVSGGAPVTGRVTAVRVRSGPNPAPLRFTVLRFVSGLTVDGQLIPNSTQCCFGESVTRTFPMTPNAVTTVGLNLPVVAENRPSEGLVINDYVGVSADSNTGALPVAVTASPPNSSHFGQPGVPQVVLHYPEITPEQVRTDSFSVPDHLLSVVFTMCTSGGGAARLQSSATFRAGGTCGGTVRTRAVRAKRGKVRVPIACVGQCSGTLKLLRTKGKRALSSVARFTVEPGAKGTVTVKLNRAGKKATKGKRTVRAKAVVKAQGGTTTKVIRVK